MSAGQPQPMYTSKQAIAGIRIEPTWNVLGPFQVGTREAVWGSDPLAAHGGFSSLPYHPESTFASSLSQDGLVRWTQHKLACSSSSKSASADIHISFPGIDWAFFNSYYGWAACQYQAWCRGTFTLDGSSPRNVVIYADPILEINLDGERHFGGDFFSFRRAPLILNVSPGEHTIELRLVRDARAMGPAINDPKVEAAFEIRILEDLHANEAYTIFPDVVNDSFASRYASVSLENFGDEAVEILAVNSSQHNHVVLHDPGLQIEVGQARPVRLDLSSQSQKNGVVQLSITYRPTRKEIEFTLVLTVTLERRSIHDTHKITYLHPSGIVSYGVLRPPQRSSTKESHSLPILIGLHGAGLDAASPEMMSSMNAIADLSVWFLFPSGVTTWSSDDWHHWGWRDVQAAVESVPHWIAENNWLGPKADMDRWIVSGHSNGGQGAYYALCHWPDKFIAGASASGYTSIQSYVSYQLWRETDPARTSIVQAALNNFRHELLAPNLRNIPLFLQHGSADNNVPVFHSRRMHELLQEQGIAASYSEIRGQDHWWDGALATPGLRKFLETNLNAPATEPHLKEFSFVVTDPADFGTKNGLKINLLHSPGRLARVDVKRINGAFHLRSSNVKSMSLPARWIQDDHLSLDDQVLQIPTRESNDALVHVVQIRKGHWSVPIGAIDDDAQPNIFKLGGGLQAILRTTGSITVAPTSVKAQKTALSVARNLYQYYAADVLLQTTEHGREHIQGNIITVGFSESVPVCLLGDHPIRIAGHRIILKDSGGAEHVYDETDSGLAAIFLRPWRNGTLELVIWGATVQALESASRLAPTITGAGQPDFVVLTADSAWKGVGGALAMGFFDDEWNITPAAFLS